MDRGDQGGQEGELDARVPRPGVDRRFRVW